MGLDSYLYIYIGTVVFALSGLSVSVLYSRSRQVQSFQSPNCAGVVAVPIPPPPSSVRSFALVDGVRVSSATTARRLHLSRPLLAGCCPVYRARGIFRFRLLVVRSRSLYCLRPYSYRCCRSSIGFRLLIWIKIFFTLVCSVFILCSFQCRPRVFIRLIRS